jgi:hypothetical protein
MHAPRTPKKVVVGFAVLAAECPRRKPPDQLERKAHLWIVGQQFAGDFLHGLVREDVAVAALAQQLQRRLQPQPVARHTAIGAGPRVTGADAVPRAAAAVGQQQLERDLFTEELIEFQIGRNTEGIDVEAEQLVDRFAAAETFGHQ